MSTTLAVTLQAVAQELANSFETRYRQDANKTPFTCLTDKASKADNWRMAAIHAAHDDREILPDDYRWRWASEAADAYTDRPSDDWDNVTAELEADVYVSDLANWLGSSTARICYLTEAIEYGETDGGDALALAQVLEMAEVYYTIRQAIFEEWERRCNA